MLTCAFLAASASAAGPAVTELCAARVWQAVAAQELQPARAAAPAAAAAAGAARMDLGALELELQVRTGAICRVELWCTSLYKVSPLVLARNNLACAAALFYLRAAHHDCCWRDAHWISNASLYVQLHSRSAWAQGLKDPLLRHADCALFAFEQAKLAGRKRRLEEGGEQAAQPPRHRSLPRSGAAPKAAFAPDPLDLQKLRAGALCTDKRRARLAPRLSGIAL